MLYVFCYDIPSNRRRVKAANILLDFGGRFQKSCFECDLPTDARRRELVRRLQAVLDLRADTLRVYRVCGACRAEAMTLGLDTVPEPPQLVLIL